MAISRRDFLALAGSAAAATVGPFSTAAKAAMGPSDKFDLVIKGGDLLDSRQSLRGKRDIGIRWGMVEAIEAEIPAARALKTLDATGKLTAECCQSPFSVR
jgi:dihydroorotase